MTDQSQGREESFIDRLRRIEAERAAGLLRRRARPAEAPRPQMIIHGDGVVVVRRKPAHQRLRFGFPLKGLLIATALVMLVKAFLIWALGDATYTRIVDTLLDGPRLAQAAGHVLAPDRATLILVDAYQWVAVQTLVFFTG